MATGIIIANIEFTVYRDTYDEVVAAALNMLDEFGFPADHTVVSLSIFPAQEIISLGSRDAIIEWKAEVSARHYPPSRRPMPDDDVLTAAEAFDQKGSDL